MIYQYSIKNSKKEKKVKKKSLKENGSNMELSHIAQILRIAFRRSTNLAAVADLYSKIVIYKYVKVD